MVEPKWLSWQVLKLWYDYDLDHDILLWHPTNTDIHFAINCSDFFDWGTADSEDITSYNIEALKRLLMKHRNLDHCSAHVLLLWCAIQRNRPPLLRFTLTAPSWFRDEVERRWP